MISYIANSTDTQKHLRASSRFLGVVLLFVVYIFNSASTFAFQSTSLKAAIDSTVIEMGDRTNIHVRVAIPADKIGIAGLTDIPEVGSTYNGVDIIEVKADTIEPDNNKSGIVVDYNILIQAFDPGLVTLPPFGALTNPDGTDTVFSEIVTLKVLAVDVDSLETINPMESVVEPDTRWYDYIPEWTYWILLGIAILGLIATILYFILNRKKIEAERKAVVIPPYDLAMGRLNNLRGRNLPENGQEKEYYTELVDILRQYLDGRFDINAMEMVSSEILRALRRNEETRMTAQQIQTVLEIADFVKFAKVRPLPDDNVKSFNIAINFVEQTKPLPPTPEESSNDTNKNKK